MSSASVVVTRKKRSASATGKPSLGARTSFTRRQRLAHKKHRSRHLHIPFLRLDGAKLHGGGQILRNSIVYAALLEKPIHVFNIRSPTGPRRGRGGLRHQHLTAVQLVTKILGGSIRGAEIGSDEVWYTPKSLVPIDKAKVSTPRGTGSSLRKRRRAKKRSQSVDHTMEDPMVAGIGSQFEELTFYETGSDVRKCETSEFRRDLSPESAHMFERFDDLLVGSESYPVREWRADIGSAGSISLLLQVALPLLLYYPDAFPSVLRLRVKGGTNVCFSPSIDYFERVLIPTLNQAFHFEEGFLKVEVEQRGFFPRGGGRVTLTVDRRLQQFRQLVAFSLPLLPYGLDCDYQLESERGTAVSREHTVESDERYYTVGSVESALSDFDIQRGVDGGGDDTVEVDDSHVLKHVDAGARHSCAIGMSVRVVLHSVGGRVIDSTAASALFDSLKRECRTQIEARILRLNELYASPILNAAVKTTLSNCDFELDYGSNGDAFQLILCAKVSSSLSSTNNCTTHISPADDSKSAIDSQQHSEKRYCYFGAETLLGASELYYEGRSAHGTGGRGTKPFYKTTIAAATVNVANLVEACKQTTFALFSDIERGASCDRFMQDQLILFMALASGRSLFVIGNQNAALQSSSEIHSTQYYSSDAAVVDGDFSAARISQSQSLSHTRSGSVPSLSLPTISEPMRSDSMGKRTSAVSGSGTRGSAKMDSAGLVESSARLIEEFLETRTKTAIRFADALTDVRPVASIDPSTGHVFVKCNGVGVVNKGAEKLWPVVFGFGSLLSEKSARNTCPNLRNFGFAKLYGYRCVFGHPAPVFFKRGIAKMESLEIASLVAETVRKRDVVSFLVDDCKDFIVVSHFQVPADEFQSFVEGEEEFDFRMVRATRLRYPLLQMSDDTCAAAVEDVKRSDTSLSHFSNRGLVEGVLCVHGSDELCISKWGRRKFEDNVMAVGLKTIWHWRGPIYPCRLYLRMILKALLHQTSAMAALRSAAAAKGLKEEDTEDTEEHWVYANFLDTTFLSDRCTSLRKYLEGRIDSILHERVPPPLEHLYGVYD